MTRFAQACARWWLALTLFMIRVLCDIDEERAIRTLTLLVAGVYKGFFGTSPEEFIRDAEGQRQRRDRS